MPAFVSARSVPVRTTVFHALYHVVEHFAMHTGQIAYLTKERSGRDLGFYRNAGGLAVPEWEAKLPKR